MNTFFIQTGVIPSPTDDRDYNIKKLTNASITTFPTSFRIPYNGTIKNQMDVGSCVGHSLAYCREIVEAKQSGVFKEFSPGFIYGNRLPSDHQGIGMYLREALNQLVKVGAVLQTDFPYNIEYPAIKSKFTGKEQLLANKAVPYRISAYARLTTVDEIRLALMTLGPVTFGMSVYSEYEKPLGLNNNIATPPKRDAWIKGHHEMTIVGWREDNTFIILNSYGQGSYDNGYLYIPFEIMMNPNYGAFDIYGMTDQILPDKSKYFGTGSTGEPTILVFAPTGGEVMIFISSLDEMLQKGYKLPSDVTTADVDRLKMIKEGVDKDGDKTVKCYTPDLKIAWIKEKELSYWLSKGYKRA